jgi:succinate dehydrogenase subunit C
VAATPNYTDYHPRWLRRRVSTYWWLGSWSYFAFVLREASCLFVAWFVVYLLLLVRAVGHGETNYQEFLSWSATPAIRWLNVVSFLFLVYHAYTFFDAAPRAMVVHLGKTRLPASLIAGGHYAAWIVASAVVFWVLLRV